MKLGSGLDPEPIESVQLTTQATGPQIQAMPVDRESESSADGYGYTVVQLKLPIV